MTPKIQVSNDGKTITVVGESDTLTAVKCHSPEDQRDFILLTELNGKPFDIQTCSSPFLFEAEVFLKANGYEQIDIQIGEESYIYPAYECLETLPWIEEDVQLVSELSRYDGPISGYFTAGGQFFHFDWCMFSFTNKMEFNRGPRIFYARKIPASMRPDIEAWLKRYEDDSDESPEASWQAQPDYAQYPITHRWSEAFDEKQDFAAIRIVYKDEGTDS